MAKTDETLTELEETPKGKKYIDARLRLTKEQIQRLDRVAAKVGLSRNELITRLLFYRIPVESQSDMEMSKALLKTNADMGRLGGLLKLWLTNDQKLKQFSVMNILLLLEKIEKTRQEIRLLLEKYKAMFDARK